MSFFNRSKKKEVVARETIGGRFMMKLDLVIELKDCSLVLCGTLMNGQVHVGDKICIASDDGIIKAIPIQGMETQINGVPTKVEVGLPGHKLAVRIVGVKKDDVNEGDVIVNYDVE